MAMLHEILMAYMAQATVILTEQGTTSYLSLFARDGAVVISIGAAPLKEGSVLLQATHIQVMYSAIEGQDQDHADTACHGADAKGGGEVDDCLQGSEEVRTDTRDAPSSDYSASRHRRKLQATLLHAMNLASTRFGLPRTRLKAPL